ncbi:MAG TPA: hypothetical protein VJI96_05395, partial [Candidatus Andersenbacteria bacterium]|nr:hypothetical protein [Candidatus Andersenbacteria bacterium]
MAVDPNMKTPLLQHHYLWTTSKKGGNSTVIIGPDPLELTDDDRIIAPDPDSPGQVTFVDGDSSLREHIYPFVIIQPGEYAVIHNPASNATFPDYPNGSWRSKRQDVPSLNMGKKRVVIQGSFPLWPGQWVEVRKVPTIQSDQFLLVAVEDPAAI